MRTRSGSDHGMSAPALHNTTTRPIHPHQRHTSCMRYPTTSRKPILRSVGLVYLFAAQQQSRPLACSRVENARHGPRTPRTWALGPWILRPRPSWGAPWHAAQPARRPDCQWVWTARGADVTSPARTPAHTHRRTTTASPSSPGGQHDQPEAREPSSPRHAACHVGTRLAISFDPVMSRNRSSAGAGGCTREIRTRLKRFHFTLSHELLSFFFLRIQSVVVHEHAV